MEYQIIQTKNKHIAIILDYQDIQEKGLAFNFFKINQKNKTKSNILATIHLLSKLLPTNNDLNNLNNSNTNKELVLEIESMQINNILSNATEILLFVVDCKNEDEIMYQKNLHIVY